MSFLRHGEIYPPMDGGPAVPGPAHRLDGFPTGYSLAGCSPAEPASASPASLILLLSCSQAERFAANGKLSLISVSHRRGALHRLSPGLEPRLVGGGAVQARQRDVVHPQIHR